MLRPRKIIIHVTVEETVCLEIEHKDSTITEQFLQSLEQVRITDTLYTPLDDYLLRYIASSSNNDRLIDYLHSDLVIVSD